MNKYFILNILLALAVLSSAQRPDFVLELCRHGARAPLDTNYDQTWNVEALGDLTAVGMRQHYLLGSAIAKEYPYLFQNPLYNDTVYILSDAVDRCMQSADSQFFGITSGTGPSLPANYPSSRAVPPYNSPYINQTLSGLTNNAVFPNRYYPSIINYVDTFEEILMFNTDNPALCPNVYLWWAQNFLDDKAQQAWQAFQPLIQYINQNSNPPLNITDGPQFADFGDSFFVDYYDNRTLPGNLSYNPDLITNMSFAFSWYQAHTWEGQAIQQQSNAYGFANGFIGYLQSYINGSNPAQFVLLSGHDNNIHTLLTPLGIVTDDCIMENYLSYWANGTIPFPNCHFPWFASQLKIELYNTTNPYVRFYYEDELIPLCGFQPECSLNEFISLLENITGNVTYSQYLANCNATESSEVSDAFNSYGFGPVAVESLIKVKGEEPKITLQEAAILGLTLLCISLGALFIRERKNHRQEIERVRNSLMM